MQVQASDPSVTLATPIRAKWTVVTVYNPCVASHSTLTINSAPRIDLSLSSSASPTNGSVIPYVSEDEMRLYYDL